MSVNVKQNGALTRVAGLYESAIPIGLAERYSTEERQVGVWTDGKPLYEKAFTITSVSAPNPGNWCTLSDISITDLENVVKGFGYLPTTKIAKIYGWKVNGSTVQCMYHTSDYKPATGEIVVVYYTKTSDTPGSGIYASDEATLAMLGDVDINTPTDGQVIMYDPINQKWVNGDASGGVNYSTTERKVGTWIDGSDVYEITYLIEKSDLVSQGSNNYNYIWSIPFDRVVDLRPIIKYNVNYTTIPSGTTNSNYQNYISQLTNNNIQFTLGANIWSQLNDIKITLLYTKATS